MRKIGMRFASWVVQILARAPEWVYGRRKLMEFFLLYMIINTMAGMNKDGE